MLEPAALRPAPPGSSRRKEAREKRKKKNRARKKGENAKAGSAARGKEGRIRVGPLFDLLGQKRKKKKKRAKRRSGRVLATHQTRRPSEPPSLTREGSEGGARKACVEEGVRRRRYAKNVRISQSPGFLNRRLGIGVGQSHSIIHRRTMIVTD